MQFMEIIREKISPKNVSFLFDQRAVYTSDFRAIGESADYDIPAMWKYENLMPWIVENQKVFINNDHNIKYSNKNNLITIPKAPNSQVSIYKRSEKIALAGDIKSLWVAIPHPDADCFAQKNNLNLNYSYEDFLYRNNKIKQKKLLKNITPSWKLFFKKEEIKEVIDSESKGFLKREHGSGGFTVFNLDKESERQNLIKMIDENDSNWYFEEQVEGAPCSVQCLKDGKSGKVIIFGFAVQIMEEDKYFKGLDIKPLETLKENVFDSLCIAIKRLSPLLENYEGFFGIDFFIDEFGKILVLEFNIRLTSATIPTLLLNKKKLSEGLYLEEEDEITSEREVISLNYDSVNKKTDYLSFYKK